MTVKNEVNRLVVEFASLVGDEDHYPLSKQSQIWLVCETDGANTAPTWRAISNINWAYSQIGSICDKEAIEAEFKERLVCGKAYKAEDYIGLWRDEVKRPFAVESLHELRLTIVGIVSHPTKGLDANLATEKDRTIRKMLDSEFVTARTDKMTTWSIPLDSLENCGLYYTCAGMWFCRETYPEDRENRIEVISTGKLVLPVPVNMSFDLFETVGEAA
jgi:hypothetical protein